MWGSEKCLSLVPFPLVSIVYETYEIYHRSLLSFYGVLKP
jgi:hypothetical protein